MRHDQALSIARRLVEQFAPVCKRIEIAGSVRRGKPDVHDIEIVAIPRMKEIEDLFGVSVTTESLLEDATRGLGKFKKDGPRYKQILLPEDIHLDLFIVTPPAQWGAIFAIRTGPSDFSHWLVTPRPYGGAMPSYLHEKDGALWRGDVAVETPEEADFFKALGLPWIEPRDRSRPIGFQHLLRDTRTHQRVDHLEREFHARS